MVFNGKWRLLRFVILITFLAVCLFTVYIPHLTAVPPKQVKYFPRNQKIGSTAQKTIFKREKYFARNQQVGSTTEKSIVTGEKFFARNQQLGSTAQKSIFTREKYFASNQQVGSTAQKSISTKEKHFARNQQVGTEKSIVKREKDFAKNQQVGSTTEKSIVKGEKYFSTARNQQIGSTTTKSIVNGEKYFSKAGTQLLGSTTEKIVIAGVRGWELNVTRDVTRYVNPSNDTTIISGREICEDSTFLVIIVTSAPANFVVRSAIRETWASHNISNVKLGFLVGVTGNSSIQNAIEEESFEFKDIIQDNFIDSYNNLTLKSIVLLKWFVIHCHSSLHQPVFLMKADDDSYVNVKELTKRLQLQPQQGLLAGVLICKAKPITDVFNKWYSPKYMYHGAFYPNYLSGTGYVMSRDVAAKLYDAALRTPIHYLEDVYITGICAEKARVRPRAFHGFNYENLGLKCSPDIITNHRLTPSDLRALWLLRDNCTEVKASAPPTKKRLSSGCH